MTVWKHRVLTLTGEKHTAELDDAGAQGWELVAVIPMGSRISYYLKRPQETSKALER